MFVWSTRRCSYTAGGAQPALGQQPAEEKSLLAPDTLLNKMSGKKYTHSITSSHVPALIDHKTNKRPTSSQKNTVSVICLKWTVKVTAAISKNTRNLQCRDGYGNNSSTEEHHKKATLLTLKGSITEFFFSP